MANIKQLDDWFDAAWLACTKTDRKTKYDFNKFTFPSKFTLKIYRHDFTLQEAEDNQQELKILINKLNNNYNTTNEIKKTRKRRYLKVCKKIAFYQRRHHKAFKNGIFPYIDGFKLEKESDEESDENEEIDTTNMLI